MILYDHFKIWLRIFYWSGLAPFPKIDEKLRCYPFIFSVLVYLFINISLIVFSMIFKFYDSYGNIATIVNCAYTVSLSLTNICANVQCYNHKAIYRKIIRRIEKIENNFNNKFSKNISFDTLANRYKLQILVVFGFLFIISLFKFYESWLESGYQMFIISALTILTQCMSVLVLLHTILYIHIVQQFLYELNERIRKAPICFYPSSKIEFLKTVEIIYMDVYKLMMQINSFFSSSLPLLVVHLAIHVTYYFYWIFLILQVEWNLLYITGMYTIFEKEKTCNRTVDARILAPFHKNQYFVKIENIFARISKLPIFCKMEMCLVYVEVT